MKSFRKVLSIVLCVMLFVQMGCMNFGSAAQADYTIVNPYKDVIWSGENAWGAYKGSLHTHSTYSDANEPLSVMVKGAYDQGYDFLAFADHGVTGVEWDESPFFHPLYLYQERHLSRQRLWHDSRFWRKRIQQPFTYKEPR